MADEFEDCPNCDATGYQGNPGVYVFTCKTCEGSGRVPAGDPPAWAMAAALDLFERAKAKSGIDDDLAVALLCLASAIAEGRELSRELEELRSKPAPE